LSDTAASPINKDEAPKPFPCPTSTIGTPALSAA